MRARASSIGIHYFDVLGGAVVLVLAVRMMAMAIGGSKWDARTGVAVGAFGLTLAVLGALRARAYREPIPWIAGSFAATAAIATIALFWPLHVMWFAAALGASGVLLTIALVLRPKRLSERIASRDVVKLAAIGIGLSLGLVCVEIALRLVPGMLGEEMRQMITADPTQYGIAHPYIGYLHRPNTTTVMSGKDFRAVHQVDGAGFRNRWPWPERASIVAVGDSLTFGYLAAPEEAWPAIIARNLPNAPVINLGLIGSGPPQYLRVYETFGVKLQPKLLLVGVFPSNDFWDAEMFDGWLAAGAEGNYGVWRDFGRPGPLVLSMTDPIGTLRSVFDRYGYPAMRMSRVYNLLRALGGGGGGDISRVPFRFSDGQEIQLSTNFSDKTELAAEGSHGFRVAIEAFEGLQSLAREHGTQLLLVLQPSKEEVYLPLLQREAPDLTSALRKALDERGIEYLDLLSGFRERAAAGERLFYEIDGHPNPAGYALTARMILQHLNEHSQTYGLTDRAPAIPRPQPRATDSGQAADR